MIFQVNNNLHVHKQSGVTLLLSVLLLSAITTIAFSLAAVGFAEISTSNDLSRTEPILYYSLGLAEEGAYGVKRSVASLKSSLGAECSGNFTQFVLDSSNVTNTKTKICNINSPNAPGNIEVIVPVNTYNSSVRLYIYDPTNSGTGGSGYSDVSFKKTSNNSGSVRMYMCPLSVECQDPNINPNGWVNPAGVLLDYNTDVNIPLSNGSYEVVFINGGSALEYVEVITRPKGLPYLNKEGIEIQSSFGRLIRRLRVLVPTQ